ncbi:uncharacterized protein LOC111882023 [Lactuca sativa]|uniref:uncharacterized protein LOC111882023 n=1 Tax=Lactuca sativa TaxID=4236 RepID=UPI000CD8AE70|nr:uncharacterized protein LOC111882023 [Lactuca sativa]
MADSLLSSIATFHTTKIIITDPTKYYFIGSIPDTMLACVSQARNVLQQYRKIPSSGPRELTPAMVRSIEETDKPAKKGKKPETQKETMVTKPNKDTTTTTTTTWAHYTAPTPPVTTEPPVTIEPSTTTKPLSPTPSTDTTPVLGGEDLEFDSTYFSPYRVQSDEDEDAPVTKCHLKAVNDKLDQLLSSSSSGAYSDDSLKDFSVGDVHSILPHLLDAHDPIINITIRRHLAEKLRPALDILSRIEGVSVTGVQPKQGGEKAAKNQPPPEPKPTVEPKDNEASISKRDKKKKKIGEDNTDDEDDVYEENPEKPYQKTKSTDKELEEKFKKQMDDLEKKQKEKELMEKKKSIFPKWTIDSLQKSAIDEPSVLWLEPVMSFGLENSKDEQFDMPIT